MKKLVQILAVILVVCLAGSAFADGFIISGNQGKDVSVPIDVESKDAAFTILKYTYEKDKLEYKDTQINEGIAGAYKDGQIAIADIRNALNGAVGSILFKVKEYAAMGETKITFTAAGTYNKDEKETTVKIIDQGIVIEIPISSYVRRCYNLILGRDPDEQGLINWTKKLETKELGASSIVNGFMNSAEYISQGNPSEKTVEILYNTMLGRESDPAGKANWVDGMEKGATSLDIIEGFTGSQEFIGICSDYGIENLTQGLGGFVERCYTQALGRPADEAGYSYWRDHLANKEITPKEAAYGFVFSAEMNAAEKIREDPEALLRSLYKLYLGRPADEAGLEYWKQKIEEGYTLEDLNNGFADSQEFKSIVESYGL